MQVRRGHMRSLSQGRFYEKSLAQWLSALVSLVLLCVYVVLKLPATYIDCLVLLSIIF